MRLHAYGAYDHHERAAPEIRPRCTGGDAVLGSGRLLFLCSDGGGQRGLVYVINTRARTDLPASATADCTGNDVVPPIQGGSVDLCDPVAVGVGALIVGRRLYLDDDGNGVVYWATLRGRLYG